MTLSAIIPTKNRPHDLANAVASLLAQTRAPDELVVIDQSEGSESTERVHALLAPHPHIRLVYVHDPSVTGLVHAKHVAVGRASSDVIAFLEDDVVLEPDYVEAVLDGFAAKPEMYGCGGVVTNPPYTSAVYIRLQSVFLRGIFRDPRAKIFAVLPRLGTGLIPCDVVSGGLSSWRADVFRHVSFDTRNGFHMFEDMEFATRVVRALGHCLYINPRARLAHFGSPVNRDQHGARQQRKISEAIVFYRKRRTWQGATSGMLMGAAWWFGEALVQACRLRTAGPVRGYLRGALEGWRRPVVTG